MSVGGVYSIQWDPMVSCLNILYCLRFSSMFIGLQCNRWDSGKLLLVCRLISEMVWYCDRSALYFLRFHYIVTGVFCISSSYDIVTSLHFVTEDSITLWLVCSLVNGFIWYSYRPALFYLRFHYNVCGMCCVEWDYVRKVSWCRVLPEILWYVDWVYCMTRDSMSVIRERCVGWNSRVLWMGCTLLG